MDIVCIDETEVSQAARYTETQPVNNVSGDGTHDVGMEDDLANGVCGTRYQKINSVFKIVVEIWKAGVISRAFRGKAGALTGGIIIFLVIGPLPRVDMHSVILSIMYPRGRTKLYRQILGRRNTNPDKERFRGRRRIEIQHNALVDFNHGSSDVATHYGAFEDFF